MPHTSEGTLLKSLNFQFSDQIGRYLCWKWWGAFVLYQHFVDRIWLVYQCHRISITHPLESGVPSDTALSSSKIQNICTMRDSRNYSHRSYLSAPSPHFINHWKVDSIYVFTPNVIVHSIAERIEWKWGINFQSQFCGRNTNLYLSHLPPLIEREKIPLNILPPKQVSSGSHSGIKMVIPDVLISSTYWIEPKEERAEIYFLTHTSYA